MGYIVSSTAAVAMAFAVAWSSDGSWNLPTEQAPLGDEISDRGLPTVDVVAANGDRSQRPIMQVSWPEVVLKTVFLVIFGLLTVFCGWAASKQPKRSVRYSRGKRTLTTAFEQKQAQPSRRRAPPAFKDADRSIASDPEDFALMRTDKEEDGVKIARETFNMEVNQSGTPDDVRPDLQDRVVEEAPTATPPLPQRAPAEGQAKDAALLRRRLLALPTPARRRQ